MLASLGIFVGYIAPFFEGIERGSNENSTTEMTRGFDPNGTNHQLQSVFHVTDYSKTLNRIAYANEQSEELKQLKPILRMIMQCMVSPTHC